MVVAFLRGINVGGHNKIAMSELRELFEAVGFKGAQTVLQSGNVIFDAPAHSGDLLRNEIQKRFGLSIEVFVRTAAELQSIVDANPFPEEVETDSSHALVMFTREPIDSDMAANVQRVIVGPEVARAAAGHLLVHYSAGIGISKLTNKMLEATLGMRGTARNWNTLLRILAIAAGGA